MIMKDLQTDSNVGRGFPSSQPDSNNFDSPRATSSISLQFDELPQELYRKSEWTDADVELVLEMLSHNLELLRFMIDCLVRNTRTAL